MEQSIFDDDKTKDLPVAVMLLDSHRYWTKKRWLFNLIVGMTGLAAVLIFSNLYLDINDCFGIVVWGVVANGLYTLGFVWESSIITKSNGTRNLQMNRGFLFWTGTIAYVLANIFVAAEYYMLIKTS